MKESYQKGLTIHLSRDFSWDIQYRLTGVATNGTLAKSYGYDPLGRRGD